MLLYLCCPFNYFITCVCYIRLFCWSRCVYVYRVVLFLYDRQSAVRFIFLVVLVQFYLALKFWFSSFGSSYSSCKFILMWSIDFIFYDVCCYVLIICFTWCKVNWSRVVCVYRVFNLISVSRSYFFVWLMLCLYRTMFRVCCVVFVLLIAVMIKFYGFDFVFM